MGAFKGARLLQEEKMRTYFFPLLGLMAAVLIASSALAQSQQVLDAGRTLTAGGNTIGGPGLFSFSPNQGVNVMDLSGAADSVCATVLAVSGTIEINVRDPADTVLEGSIANATPGPGGVSAGATACANNVGLVEVHCSSTSTEDCKGAWRVDKK
jgi:hypothetical protein